MKRRAMIGGLFCMLFVIGCAIESEPDREESVEQTTAGGVEGDVEVTPAPTPAPVPAPAMCTCTIPRYSAASPSYSNSTCTNDITGTQVTVPLAPGYTTCASMSGNVTYPVYYTTGTMCISGLVYLRNCS